MEHTFVKVDTIRRPRADGPVDEIDVYQCHACDTIVEAGDLDETQQSPCLGGDEYITVNTSEGPKFRQQVPAIEHTSGVCNRRDTPVFPDPFFHFDD